jgi:hypothetical protein
MAILALAALIAVLALAIQLGLPRLVERKAAQRLTENGGHARVHLRAFPVTRLLRGRGDSLVVKASGLVATREGGSGGDRGGGLEQLDGFAHVDIQVIGVRLGPLSISRFHLHRQALGEPYRATVQATVTPEDMARYAGGRLGGFLTAALVGAGTEIPLDVEATLGSDGVTAVTGSVAGFPAGPFVEALIAALASKL